MAKTKNNLINERKSLGTFGVAIAETLIKGEKVLIPDFGYLELVSFSDKRTVFFKPFNNSLIITDLFANNSEGKEEKDLVLYNSLSLPLKEGKSVSIPEVGIFRPVKNDDGSMRILFTLSSSFRNQLKIGGEPPQELVIESSNVEKIIAEQSNSNTITELQEKEAKVEKEIIISENKKPAKIVNNATKETDPKVNAKSNLTNIAKVGDIIVPQDDVPGPKKKNIVGLLLAIVSCVAVVIVILSILLHDNNDKKEEPVLEVVQKESINLPSLATQNYGNPIFWVYIYDANRELLTSPVNISKEIGNKLVIPNLLEEYGVDVSDSMEIRRANMLLEVILKQVK